MLHEYETRLKSVSLLPYLDPSTPGPNGLPYQQIPFESITESEYATRAAQVRALDLSSLHPAVYATTSKPAVPDQLGLVPSGDLWCSRDGCTSPSVPVV